MICDHCKKDKPDTMARLALLGAEKLDGKYCTACCCALLPNRKWMEAAAADAEANA